MKTIGVDVQNSLSSRLPIFCILCESFFYRDTKSHIFINTEIHTYICTHIVVFCITLPVKKHAKVQKEKANMLTKLRLQGSSMDLVIERFRFPGEHLWFTQPRF